MIRNTLAAFPGEDVIVFEYFGGLNHLTWTGETEGRFESISVPIPTAWLEEPALEAKLAETSRNFAACVLKEKNDRGSIQPARTE